MSLLVQNILYPRQSGSFNVHLYLPVAHFGGMGKKTHLGIGNVKSKAQRLRIPDQETSKSHQFVKILELAVQIFKRRKRDSGVVSCRKPNCFDKCNDLFPNFNLGSNVSKHPHGPKESSKDPTPFYSLFLVLPIRLTTC
ncbi:MAG: hypothetical protein ACI8ZB_004035 [Desulforhopalus sp.]|jgi:hypothetical protein